LEEFIKNQSRDTFESSIGKLLLSIKRKDFEKYEKVMQDTRCRLMNSIAAASMESYQRSYDTILELSLLFEMDNFVKTMLTDFTIQDNFKQLNNIWDGRLKLAVNSLLTKDASFSGQRTDFKP
jgi:serine/threonine-protein kinase ATR